MAIDVRTDLVCAGNRSRAPDHPAVAFVRDPAEGIWELCCAGCLQELGPDPITYDVVYLDPTRQRRPQPDHDHWTEYHIDEHGRVVPDANLVPRPDPAP